MKIIFGIGLFVLAMTVLIGGVNYYLTPSDPLGQADVVVAISGGDTKARARAAVDVYQQGYAPKILFSGAALDPLSPSNAQVMSRVALDAGVPEEDIIIEETAANTEENAQKSQNIIEESGYMKIILVTSPYHQRRAYLEFADKLDREVVIINYSSEDSSWPDTWWLTPRGWWLGFGETVKTAVTATKNLF